MTLNGKDVNSFKIYANGKVFAGPFTTDTRKNTTKFIELIDALNQDDAVVNHGRWQTVFERSNISSVLPTYMSNNFNCDIN